MRIANVRGIFAVQNEAALYEKNIILVDDVATTGATLQEAARMISHSGAHQIWGLVLAKD
jgi:competence protein ComFC